MKQMKTLHRRHRLQWYPISVDGLSIWGFSPNLVLAWLQSTPGGRYYLDIGVTRGKQGQVTEAWIWFERSEDRVLYALTWT
jgi:hypothetical protein